ncbi:dimethyl sulfoxide reductase anchor subunit family protein [Photobacterium minamisatsumaniensis]|uniref:dimethyl sulfoxide reductase anchor subunit family protein n=1 Tax=Photobacterium minamisatsumaniensis TaxID=2910233 RepID=UPI003D0E8687
MHELPLVFFTVLGQTAVGAYLILLLSQKANATSEQQLSRSLLVTTLILSIGMIVGMFHLGHPLRAFNLLSGLGRSPMSNEIVLGGCFAAFGLLAGLAGNYGAGTAKQRLVLRWVGALFAIAFVVMIPSVYQLSTVATWDTPHTTFQMLITVLITGGGLAAVIGAYRQGMVVCIVATLAALVMRSDYLTFVTSVNPILSSQQSSLWLIQSVALCIGISVAIYGMLKHNTSKPVLWSVCGLLVVGELVGRISFYNLWSLTM